MSSNAFAGIALDSRPRLELAALIDMSFLMLIFFMVSATLQKQEADLPVQLPDSAAASGALSTMSMERMAVDVDDRGTIRLNREVLSTRPGVTEVKILEERLLRYAAVAQATGNTPQVEIRCADAAAEQRFIDVISACHAAGIQGINLVDE